MLRKDQVLSLSSDDILGGLRKTSRNDCKVWKLFDNRDVSIIHTLSLNENFVPGFTKIWFFDTQNTFHLFVSLWRGSKMHCRYLYASVIPLSDHFVTEQEQALKRNGNSCSWINMTFFLDKIRFRTHTGCFFTGPS